MQGIKSIGGVCRRLKRWRIAGKQGRLHTTSPDPEYQAKITQVEEVRAAARSVALRATSEQQPERVSMLYGEAFTFYGQPCLGRVYHQQGQRQPSAP